MLSAIQAEGNWEMLKPKGEIKRAGVCAEGFKFTAFNKYLLLIELVVKGKGNLFYYSKVRIGKDGFLDVEKRRECSPSLSYQRI